MKERTISAIIFFFGVFLTSAISQSVSLDENEARDIIYLLEEEKVARDVYSLLSEKWNSQVFNNIESSEQKHLSRILRMAREYDLEIPQSILSDQRGEFSNVQLQELYGQLVEKGSESVIQAFEVGAKIEELDIKDLEDARLTTENEQLRGLYSDLIDASERHLNAFVKNLASQDIDYRPEILSEARYAEIITPTQGKGAGNCLNKSNNDNCSGCEKGKNGKKKCRHSSQDE